MHISGQLLIRQMRLLCLWWCPLYARYPPFFSHFFLFFFVFSLFTRVVILLLFINARAICAQYAGWNQDECQCALTHASGIYSFIIFKISFNLVLLFSLATHFSFTFSFRFLHFSVIMFSFFLFFPTRIPLPLIILVIIKVPMPMPWATEKMDP